MKGIPGVPAIRRHGVATLEQLLRAALHFYSGFNQLAENYDSWVSIINSIGGPMDPFEANMHPEESRADSNWPGVQTSCEFRKYNKDGGRGTCDTCNEWGPQLEALHDALVETMSQVQSLQNTLAKVCSPLFLVVFNDRGAEHINRDARPSF